MNHYPKDRQTALHLLDKYGTSTPKGGGSEGHTFFTKKDQAPKKGSKKDGARPVSFDPEYWKDKICHRCKKNWRFWNLSMMPTSVILQGTIDEDYVEAYAKRADFD